MFLKNISRGLLIYIVAVLMLAGGLAVTYKVWNNKGRTEEKMKAAVSKGEKFPWQYYVKVYGPKAVLINCGLCVFLLAAGPWGVRRLKARPMENPSDPGKKITVAVVALTMLGCAVWATPRMTQGLWTDEATSMAKFMVGEYEYDKEGKWVFDPVEADYRQFAMVTPNNHMLYSTLASLTHQALAPKPVEPQDTYFKEWILRLPAYIAGLAALASIAWLAGELGFRRAGWVAVALLALHPWHLHYMSMARGYSIIMALVPAFLAAAIRAVRTGHWKWWIVSSLCQVVMIDTWPLSADVVIVGNLIIVGMIFTSQWRGADRWTVIGRWMIISIFGAMATIQLLLPALPQIATYMQTQATGKFSVSQFIIDPLWGMFTGSPWTCADPANPYVHCWKSAMERHPVAVVLFACMLLTLFAAGWWRLWRQSWTTRWMALVVVLIPIAITLHLVKQHFFFLTWYAVPSVPCVLVTMGVGFVSLFENRRWQWAVAAPAIAAVIAFVVGPQHLTQRKVAHGQNKEAALLTRKILNPEYPGYHDEVVTGAVAAFYKCYDCAATRLNSVTDLDALIQKAKTKNLPLFISMSRENLVQGEGHQVLHRLYNPAEFDALPPLYGTEPEATMKVFRYKGEPPAPKS